MKCESAGGLVDLIRAEGSLVAALRVLNRPALASSLWIAVHHLNRHVAIVGVDKQTRTVSFVNLPVSVWLFQPGKPPRSDKPGLHGRRVRLNLAAEKGQTRNTDEHERHDRVRFSHFTLQLLLHDCLSQHWPDPNSVVTNPTSTLSRDSELTSVLIQSITLSRNRSRHRPS